jgi:heme-degrading monooxygenase HmoA
MFARTVSIQLKANSAAEFARTIENEILPLLRKQKGFQDEITLVVPDGKQALAVSFWDLKASADAYEREAYQQVLKALAKVVDGTPKVETYNVSNSTPHKIAARIAA